ncbi:MAG TPA: radical SAM protein, partial [Anaerolineales bacterium]|nr:radical SAM protein [Anaerolineales bacterium]
MTTRPRLDSLIFEVTQRYNHACLHCYNVWQAEPSLLAARSPQGQLDTARTLAVLGMALDEIGCRHVTITGGEPLLRRDLSAILDFLRKRNVRISLISNGRLLTDSTAASLIQRGVGAFELPLLSHEREIHDRLS